MKLDITRLEFGQLVWGCLRPRCFGTLTRTFIDELGLFLTGDRWCLFRGSRRVTTNAMITLCF
jgi:hypothetical protein